MSVRNLIEQMKDKYDHKVVKVKDLTYLVEDRERMIKIDKSIKEELAQIEQLRLLKKRGL